MKASSFTIAGSIAIVLVTCTLAMSGISYINTRCNALTATIDRISCVEQERSPTIDSKRTEAANEADDLMAWIAQQTQWTSRDRPPIHFISSAELRQMFFGEEAIDRKVDAAYSEKDHSVYLLDSWRPDDLRDRSILLHELVHHLQYLNHVKELCLGEFEFEAFKFQVDWLSEQGVEYPIDLIGIDPLDILMLGHCDEMSF